MEYQIKDAFNPKPFLDMKASIAVPNIVLSNSESKNGSGVLIFIAIGILVAVTFVVIKKNREETKIVQRRHTGNLYQNYFDTAEQYEN